MEGKTLIAYFSATGETKKAALAIEKVSGGVLFEIEPAVKYSKEDLNWEDKRSRSSLEMSDKKARPAIKKSTLDIEKFDTILLGFPIWWYEAPRVVQSFLESYDLTGKKIKLFYTSGSSGIGRTEEILEHSIKGKVKWGKAKRFTSSTSKAEIEEWLKG